MTERYFETSQTEGQPYLRNLYLVHMSSYYWIVVQELAVSYQASELKNSVFGIQPIMVT